MMKKLVLLISICTSFISYSQTQGQVQGQKTTVNVQNRSTTIQQRELVTSEPKTEIKVPLEVDLNNYEKLFIVDINTLSGRNRTWYNKYEERLLSSPLKIVNPVKINKKKFRKDPMFLREIKDPKSVYLYYTRKQGSGRDDINTTVILRDYQNKILYSSSHVNVGIPDILYPLIGF